MTCEPGFRGVAFSGVNPFAQFSSGVPSCGIVPVPDVIAEICDGVKEKAEGDEIKGCGDVVHVCWRIVDAISMRLL